ncbi:hypothetical protein F6Y05_39850 [Bacillus megaterium]|nr:hypothetical protein [Priestia megaterium]
MPLTRIKGKPTGIKEITLETKDMIAMGFEALRQIPIYLKGYLVKSYLF